MNIPILENQDFMIPAQKAIATEFEQGFESEVKLCVQQVKAANSSIMAVPNPDAPGVDLACREIDAVRSYWHQRLILALSIIHYRNPQKYQELIGENE